VSALLTRRHSTATLAARVLASFDLTVDKVRAEVKRVVGEGHSVARGQMPFTPSAKETLHAALHEALALKHRYIGTEHILLGLARDDTSVGARILLDAHADATAIRREIVRIVAATSQK
jgi:ATP-dependent Clp protease ATP-binding subunit ClpC